MSEASGSAARLSRPIGRYWRGKAPVGVRVQASESDSDISATNEGEYEAKGSLVATNIKGNDFVSQWKVIASSTASSLLESVVKNVDLIKDEEAIYTGLQEAGKIWHSMVYQSVN